MSNDLISRKDLFNALFVYKGKVCPDNDIDNFPINVNVRYIKDAIRNAPTAYDVDKVVEQMEKNTDFATGEDGTVIEEYVNLKVAKEIVKSGGIE